MKVRKAPMEAFDTGVALRFPNQGQFHPLKYLDGLARAIERLGGRLFCHTHATALEGGEGARVETRLGAGVSADASVVATNVPFNDRLVIHTKQAPYTTYVIGAEIAAGAATTALYWDTRQSKDQSESGDAPYHYVRLTSRAMHGEKDILIVGGEDHKSGQEANADERFARLESWTRERWPAIENVVFRWSGQVMEPADGMAFIGRNPMDKPNVYVVTGDSGNGMTHGIVAGLLLSDLIQDRPNEWASLYDPGRVIMRTAADFVKENLNVAAQYAKGYLGTGEREGADEIGPDEGAVIRRGVKKVAIFRDESGGLHELSAVCPHLGCIVAWNNVEKTWDCPCHGSRFDKIGRVINGPANTDLERIKEAVHPDQ